MLVSVPGATYRKGYIIDFDYAIEKNRGGKGPVEAERTVSGYNYVRTISDCGDVNRVPCHLLLLTYSNA